MEILTIGFTKRSAEDFFEALKKAEIRRVVDVRLRNTSQLSGFSKAGDLQFFLHRLISASYAHEPLLAPTAKMLDDYRHRSVAWDAYANLYVELLEGREVSRKLNREDFETRTILLCTEPSSERCHRRLAAEYLARSWEDVEVVHL
jgi:uncharacterized protein (DUF488 family)